MTLLLLTIISVIRHCQSTTNSSGHYITIPSIGHNESNNIECNHSILCYAHCVGANKCANLTMNMHSEQVIINCVYCDYLNVHAENASDFTMLYNSSNGGEFHINNARNVFINYNSVENSVIYAQYAEHFNFNQSNDGRYNVFYLDYVSKEINFILNPGDMDLSWFSYNTIVASYAYQFNYYALYDYFSRYLLRYNIVYCPYYHAAACNFNEKRLTEWEIFIPLPTIHADMFALPFGTIFYDIKLWCNANDDGIFQSYTNIFWDDRLEKQICSNITSECCFITTPSTNEIFCPDNSNGTCSIDCNQYKKCSNTSIYPTNSTKYMHVICNSDYSCLDTYIYCPQTLNSTCQVSCVDNETPCYQTTIKFHVNNKEMVLNAKNCRFCQGINVFVDGNQNAYDSSHTSNLTIMCNSSFCYNMGITLNAPINHLQVIATGDYGFGRLDISAAMAENILFHCNHTGCNGINLRGKTDAVDSITLKCHGIYSCRWIIFSPLEYRLDYLSHNNSRWSYSKALCDYSEQSSSIDDPHCSDNVFCCPFSNVFEKVRYCNNTQNCLITLQTNEKPIIIYANTANSLSIVCDNCSFINIFAINTNNVEIECINKCNDIHLNAMNTQNFKLKCNDECFNLIIDVNHAKNVIINANTLYETQIYAFNGNNFNLNCTNCTELDLAVPSHYQTFIYCANDCACSKFNIYNNISMNITITNCYNAINEMDSYWIDQFQWTLFCPSTVKVIHDNTYCKWNPRLQNTFCKCGYILNNTANISWNITSYQPFSHICYDPIQSPFQTFHIAIGSLFAIISFLIIILWTIVGLKYIFLKYINPSKYYEVTMIEPPSSYVLNCIHFSDLLTWIFSIYIGLLSYAVYDYADDVCSMDDKPFNWKEICVKTSFCGIYDDECVFNTSIYYIWICVVGICIAVLATLFYICRCCATDSLLFSNYVIDISHFVCLRCYTKADWNHHYLKRQFFPVFPVGNETWFKPSKCKVLLWYIIWGKYVVIFIPLLILYIGYYDASFSIEWYDVFPMLFLWGCHEIIKRQYRNLPPYDLNCHIQYVINSVYGQSLGGIIWLFLNDNQETADTHAERKIPMEKYGMISSDADIEIGKSETVEQISTEQETEIERLL